MSAITQAFRNMSQGRLVGTLITGAVLLGLLAFLAMHVVTPSLSPLYTGLSMEDSAKIVAQLDKTGVQYQLQAGGTQVLVPSDQVLRLRLTLAQQGLPTGGSMVGYEIFDRSDTLGTSNFVLNVNMLRALEGELSRTIGSLAQVDSARVHLVVPHQELFSRDRPEPTASVVLGLRGSAELSRAEISAISHLVASSVPNLKPSAVTIVDSRGQLLAKGGAQEDSEDAGGASTSAEYKTAYENRLKKTVEDLLAGSVGPGKVKVQLTADMDFDRVETNSEKFDPEGQVVRSTTSSAEKENSQESASKGDVSVANNLPQGQAEGGNNKGASGKETNNEVTNYEISKTVEHHVKEIGDVKRLSIAVLVDGTYSKNEKGEETYQPRSPEELKQIGALVRSAVGFDEKRGDSLEVVNMRFIAPDVGPQENTFVAWLKDHMSDLIKTGVIGIVSLLGLLLVVRPVLTKALDVLPAMAAGGGGSAARATQPQLTGPGAALQLPAPAGAPGDEEAHINLERVQGRIKSSSYKTITELVDKNPDETLNVVRQWVYQG